MKLELSHDILAKKVYDRISAEEKTLRKVERFIGDRFIFYQGEGKKLRGDEINYILPYLSKVDIPPEEREFVEAGLQHKRWKRLLLLLIVGGVIVGLIALSSIFAGLYFEAERLRTQSETLRKKAETATENTRIALDVAKQAKKSDSCATIEAEAARFIALAAQKSDSLARIEAQASERKAQNALGVAVEERLKADTARMVAVAARDSADIERQNAEVARDSARRKAIVVNVLTAQSMASQSLAIEDDPALKMQLAREAYCIDRYFSQIAEALGNAKLAGGYEFEANLYQALYQNQKSYHQSPQGRLVHATRPHVNVQSLQYSSQTGSLYSLGNDDRLLIHNLKEGTHTAISLPKGVLHHSLAMSPDGKFLVVGIKAANQEDHPKLRVYPLTEGTMPNPYTIDLDSFKSEKYVSLAFLDNDHLWVSLYDAKQLLSVSLRNKKYTNIRLEGEQADMKSLLQMSLSYDQQFLAAIDEKSAVKIGLVGAPQNPAPSLKLFLTQLPQASALCFSPTQNQLAIGTRSGIVYLYHLSPNPVLPPILTATLRGHNRKVTSLRFSRDGKKLASGSEDGTVRVWPVNEENFERNGPIVLTPNYPSNPTDPSVYAIDFVGQGQEIALGYNQGYVLRWPTETKAWFDPDRQNSFQKGEWILHAGEELEYKKTGYCPELSNN